MSAFPSPCGVNIVGNQLKTRTLSSYAASVSVPLRGKYCREFDFYNDNKIVPMPMFPSPCGVNIVGNVRSLDSTGLYVICVSVPLRGKYCREF